MNYSPKRGVELTMNTMIIAVLILLVLLVLAFILIKGTGTFTKSNDCTARDGICQSRCDRGYVQEPWTCPEGEKCCVKRFGT